MGKGERRDERKPLRSLELRRYGYEEIGRAPRALFETGRAVFGEMSAGFVS